MRLDIVLLKSQRTKDGVYVRMNTIHTDQCEGGNH